MPFQLRLPAGLAPAFAAGRGHPDDHRGRATTTLVGASGTIVGTRHAGPDDGATAAGATVMAAAAVRRSHGRSRWGQLALPLLRRPRCPLGRWVLCCSEGTGRRTRPKTQSC